MLLFFDWIWIPFWLLADLRLWCRQICLNWAWRSNTQAARLFIPCFQPVIYLTSRLIYILLSSTSMTCKLLYCPRSLPYLTRLYYPYMLKASNLARSLADIIQETKTSKTIWAIALSVVIWKSTTYSHYKEWHPAVFSLTLDRALSLPLNLSRLMVRLCIYRIKF